MQCNRRPLGCVGREVFRGAYGEWEVEESDVREVLGYRAGISVAATGDFLCPFQFRHDLCSHLP